METKPDLAGKGKNSAGRRLVAGLAVLLVFAALALAAQWLVSSIDLVELLKRIHGG
jgi:hypothetical protein